MNTQPITRNLNETKDRGLKVLLLGAGGAVGARLNEALITAGHTVTRAGRSARPNWVRIDAAGEDLSALQRESKLHDVVVNASGVENPALGTALGNATLVDISASASYLTALRANSPHASMILGAGLAPGLSTLMVAGLVNAPGDQVDVALMLGAGEKHGPAAVAWTQRMIGSPLHEPAEGGTVMNFREARTIADAGHNRRYLRADFPDHLLYGSSQDIAVRNYFALDSPLATTVLGMVARVPMARRLIAMAPPMGGEDWSIVVCNRRTGQSRRAWGSNQSTATAMLTAMLVHTLASSRPSGPVPITSLMSVEDIAVGGIMMEQSQPLGQS